MVTQINQDTVNKALWSACDVFRGTVSADTYKDYILTMLFLKYISDVWQDHYDNYKNEYGDEPELIEEMMKNERFVLPRVSNFYTLHERRFEPGNGERIDMALHALEEANGTKLKDVGKSVFQDISFNTDKLGEEKQKNTILKDLLEVFSVPVLDLKPSRVGSIDVIGLFAFSYAVLISIFLSVTGMFISSKIMNLTYENTFYTLGYAFAPLFIIGGLSHIGEFFFYSYASNIVNGFNQAFALGFETMAPLASRKDDWVHIFKVFNHIGYIWAFILMIKRFKLIDVKINLKILAFPFASALIIFYMGLNFYTGYVFKTYGANMSGHNHAAHQMKMENK